MTTQRPPGASPPAHDLRQAFAEHADWFIEDESVLDTDQLVSLYGYQPQRGASRAQSSRLPASIYAGLAFLILPAVALATYAYVSMI